MSLPLTGRAWLALIVVSGVAIRIIFFNGYQGGDDSAYIAHAYAYAARDFSAPYSHWGTRLAIVVPTAIAFYLFGVSDVAAIALPFMLSVGSIILAYALAVELFDEKTAILASVLVAIFPMEVLFASQLYPYTFLSFFLTASLYAFVKAEIQQSRRWHFLSGAFLGFAYLSRVTAFYAFLFFGLYTLIRRRFPRWVIPFALGLVAICSLELTFNFIQSGDPFYRFKVLAAKSADVSIAANFENSLRWFMEPFLRPLVEQEFGLFFPFMLWASFVAIRSSRREELAPLILLLWVVPLFLYSFYGPTSPSGYSPLTRIPRYYSMVIVPLLVLLAFALARMRSNLVRKAILAVLLSSSLIMLYIDGSRTVMARQKAVHAFALDNANEGIVLHRGLYFDHLYLNRFKVNPNIKLLAFPADRSDELKRIDAVAPGVDKFRTLNEICGRYLIADTKQLQREPQWAVLKRKIEHRFPKPPTVLTRVARVPLVLRILAATTSEKRIRMLFDDNDDRIVAIRIDRPCV